MLFNSYQFIFVFFPVAFAGMFLIGAFNKKLAALWLGVASLFFYTVWDSRNLPILLGSITFNYCAGLLLARFGPGTRKSLFILVTAVTGNLLLLFYFKYINFFFNSVNSLFVTEFPVLNIILPLGISFFTFTQLAFLMDVYRGIAREFNFLYYLLFVTYFPHLIAGPVLHHKQMMPQFARDETYRINPTLISAGISIFIFGLAKKVLIADYFSTLVTPVFDAINAGQTVQIAESWLGALAYTFQLYFDFSGYCDMAIGISLVLNVRLPLNFNSPYKAKSIIDFWRRWHITLSNFLRDYLYIPLGGNRKGPARRHVNLMLTMMIGGLWHGAGWTFVAWGTLHGLYLVINHGWEKLSARLNFHPPLLFANLVGGAITFLCVVLAWVLFRANDIHAAGRMFASMLGLNGVSLPASLKSLGSVAFPSSVPVGFGGLFPTTGNPDNTLFYILAGFALIWLFPNVQQIFQRFHPVWEDDKTKSVLQPLGPISRALGFEWKLTAPRAIMAGILFFICLAAMFSNKASEFLYFQF